MQVGDMALGVAAGAPAWRHAPVEGRTIVFREGPTAAVTAGALARHFPLPALTSVPLPSFPPSGVTQCKHLLAVAVADALGPTRYRERRVTDEELARVVAG